MCKKFVVILLALALVIPSLLINLEPVFAAGALKTVQEQATEDAEKAAELDARYAAVEDVTLGKRSNYAASMRTDKEIVERYKLHLDLPSYRAVFLEQYKFFYKAYYTGEYIKERTQVALSSDGTELGKIVGAAAGAVEALSDYTFERDNDWKAAFENFIRINSIRQRYDLDKQKADFADRFVHGFEEGFQQAYTEGYNGILTEIQLKNLVVQTISNAATNVVSNSFSYSVVDGKVASTTNIQFEIQFDAGTIFEQTMVNVEMEQYSFNTRNYRYSPVSNVFKVSLKNKSGNYYFRRPTNLKFSYLGSEKIGIYQWRNHRWEYLPTIQDKESVQTTIPAGKYYGGRYALFIDDTFEPIRDIAFSLAKDEINVFARRHYVSAGAHFNPKANVTRAQMAVLLYEMLKSKYPEGRTFTEAKDRSKFGPATKAIDFVLANRFMSMDNNQNFHPDLPVTFEHLQYIYKNVKEEQIMWNTVAKKIKQEKFVWRDEYENLSSPATREEAVYFLYHYIDN